MKSLWLALALIVISVTGALTLLWQERAQSMRNNAIDLPHLQELLRQELNRMSPAMTVSLEPWFSGSRKELLDPQSSYAHIPKGTLLEARELDAYARTCTPQPTAPLKRKLAKAWLWHMFVCKHLEKLPDAFFEGPPWVHPSGQSFMWLASRMGIEFKGVDGFHIREWKNLGLVKGYPDLEALSQLTEDQWLALSQGASSIPTQIYFWRLSARDADREFSYELYDMRFISRHFSKQGISVSFANLGNTCAYRDQWICWNVDRESFWERFTWPIVGMLGLGVFAMGIILLRLRQMFRENKEREHHKQLVLYALVHELRTPLTSLGLNFEKLRHHYDEIPESVQETFLAQLNDYHRLVRLSERSRQYLSVDQSSKLLIQSVHIESLEQWLLDLIARVDASVALHMRSPDGSVTLDPHWLDVCLSNLLMNAKMHGRPPISLEVTLQASVLEVDVIDQGEFEHARPFAPKGLGLGLIIVGSVIREMKGTLERKDHPTTWRIRIPL